MKDEKILHLIKKIVQLRKTQCWLCHRLDDALDTLTLEMVRRYNSGVDNNSNSDSSGDVGRSALQSKSEVWNTD